MWKKEVNEGGRERERERLTKNVNSREIYAVEFTKACLLVHSCDVQKK
jgi:hypothetical protein